jgi:hypothetical protein
MSSLEDADKARTFVLRVPPERVFTTMKRTSHERDSVFLRTKEGVSHLCGHHVHLLRRGSTPRRFYRQSLRFAAAKCQK